MFAAELQPQAEKIVADHRSTLLNLFNLSTCQSLRVLRQSLAGVERFCTVLSSEQIANVVAMKRLLSIYFATSIEVLRGDLRREDLVDRIKSYGLVMAMRKRLRSGKVEDKSEVRSTAFARSHERFSSVLEFANFDLSNELLIEMIVDGNYNKEALQKHLASSQIFEQPMDWPAWRRFIGFDSLPDDVVANAAIEMDKQFDNREVTDFGEWMQIVSLRIMRINEGLMNGALEHVVDDCIKYLDDLVAQKRFPLKPNTGVFGSHPAHGGVMLWGYEENKEVIDKIRDHVFKCEKQALQMYSPEIKKQLLSAVANSPDELGELINYSDEKGAEYQTIPVLLSLSTREFVDAFLKLPVEKWEAMQRVLSKRWGMVSANNSLAEEATWFGDLEAEMRKRSKDQKGSINSLRIERHIPRKY
jgi:hypothetical protein